MLVLKHNDAIIATVAPGSTFALPDGSFVSPAYAGWANAGGYALEPAAPPPEPTPEELLLAERAGMELTFGQLLIGLVEQGWISEAEGEGWLTGTLPPLAQALIAQLPESQRFAAKVRMVRPSVVLRLDPLTEGLAVLTNKTDEDIDQFFRVYRER